jgi:hypothetical protein
MHAKRQSNPPPQSLWRDRPQIYADGDGKAKIAANGHTLGGCDEKWTLVDGVDLVD